MQNPCAIIVQRSDCAAAAGLASRALAAAVTACPLWVLLRLDGVGLLRPAADWPTPSNELSAWLAAQEFPDLRTYLDMALAAAGARCCVCSDSLAPWKLEAAPPPWQHSCLTTFLDEVEAAGGIVEWLI